MKEKNSLNVLVEELVTLNYLEASYIENRNTEYEEIYLHMVIDPEKKDEFLNSIKNIVDNLPGLVFSKTIENGIYIKLDNNVSTFAVYEFGNYEVLSHSMVLYDPHKKLKAGKQNISYEEIGSIINDISYYLDRFYNTYLIDDKIGSLNFLNLINEMVLKFLAVNYEPTKVFRNYRQVFAELPRDLKPRYNKILAKMRVDSLLECAKMFIILMDEYINNISINIAFVVDIDYYMFVKNLIFSC